MKGTVTISTEEYNRLRDFEKDIKENSYHANSWSNKYVDIYSQFYVLNNKELMRKVNKDLEDLREEYLNKLKAKDKEIELLKDKRNLIQRILNK